MAGFNWGSFAGGVGQGVEEGQNVRAQWDARAARQLAKQADANYSAWLEKNSPIPGVGAAGAPQGPAPPPVNAMPAAPVPGAGGPPTGPMTSMQGPMAPQINGPGGPMPPTGPRPVPVPGAQPMPAPPAPPPMPAPPTSSRGAPQDGMPGMGGDPTQDVVKQSQNAIQSIAAQIVQGFPGKRWKPGELLATVDSVLGHMEKVDPIAKQMAQLQLKYYDAQIKAMQAGETARHHTATEGIGQENADTRQTSVELSHEDRQASVTASLKRAAMSDNTRERVANISASARIAAADIAQSGANGRTQAVLDYKASADAAGLSEKEWQTELGAQLKMQGMDENYIARLFSAAPQTDKSGAPSLVTPPKRNPLASPSGQRPQAPRVGGGQAAPSGAGGTPPPQAIRSLKEGVHTTFGNGQTWTLKNGKPVRVADGG